MSSSSHGQTNSAAVDLWFDPVCPFSWNTARWLTDVVGPDLRWHLMSLSVLNEGQTLPPPQQKRMDDSRLVGRLMTAVDAELGQDGLVTAYFDFGARYFEAGAPVDEQLATRVLAAAGTRMTTAAAMLDETLDSAVRRSHELSQDALGMAGGSPMMTVGGSTFFGPVLTAVPDSGSRRPLYDAVVTLASAPQFSQIQRPRSEQTGH